MRSKSSALANWFCEGSSPKHQLGHILTVDKGLRKTSACVRYHLYSIVKKQNKGQTSHEDLRTTSRLPRLCTVSSTMRCTSVSRVTSPVVIMDLISGLRLVKSLCRSLSKWMLEGKSFKAILWPSFASCRAIALPIPRAQPVTITARMIVRVEIMVGNTYSARHHKLFLPWGVLRKK